MTADQTTGQQVIRKEIIDGAIKGIANRAYKFKQAVTVVPTSAWTNTFFRENSAVLAGGTGSATRGIPRGADFPAAFVQWEKIQAIIEQYGLETMIPWADVISSEIPVRERSLYKLAEGVTKAVDDQIYSVLASDTGITTLAIETSGTTMGGAWNQSSAALIDNLEQGEQEIAEANYPTDDLMVFVNPRDKRAIVKFITDKGAQFMNTSERMLNGNGTIGKVGNKTFIVSNSVPASRALMVVPKRCATWKELEPLQTHVETDPGKNVKLRTWEFGVLEVTDPLCVVLYTGTERGN